MVGQSIHQRVCTRRCALPVLWQQGNGSRSSVWHDEWSGWMSESALVFGWTVVQEDEVPCLNAD